MWLEYRFTEEASLHLMTEELQSCVIDKKSSTKVFTTKIALTWTIYHLLIYGEQNE